MKLYHREMGSGQPLLIIHGLFGSSDNWLTHARNLSDSFRVILVDQRNHGHSPHMHEHSYDLMAQDLYELVADLGLRDLLLIGHSMGGKTILRFAQQYSFLIDRMVVADMGIRQYPPHHDLVFKGLFAVDVKDCPSRRDAEERLAGFVGEVSTRQFLLKNLYWKEHGKLDWRFNLEALYNHRSEMMAAIPDQKIETDTLFLRGGKSNYVLDEDLPVIQRLVPNASFETMPEAGHWLHAEAPEEFIAHVRNYFGHP